eukprot:333084-Rhodomonas_salina.2
MVTIAGHGHTESIGGSALGYASIVHPYLVPIRPNPVIRTGDSNRTRVPRPCQVDCTWCNAAAKVP